MNPEGEKRFPRIVGTTVWVDVVDREDDDEEDEEGAGEYERGEDGDEELGDAERVSCVGRDGGLLAIAWRYNLFKEALRP